MGIPKNITSITSPLVPTNQQSLKKRPKSFPRKYETARIKMSKGQKRSLSLYKAGIEKMKRAKDLKSSATQPLLKGSKSMKPARSKSVKSFTKVKSSGAMTRKSRATSKRKLSKKKVSKSVAPASRNITPFYNSKEHEYPVIINATSDCLQFGTPQTAPLSGPSANPEIRGYELNAQATA